LNNEPGGIVAIAGPHIDDPITVKGLNSRSAGTEAEVVNRIDDQALVRIYHDLSGLRQKVSTYESTNTPSGNPKFQGLVARIDTIRPATLSDLSSGKLDDTLPDDEQLWVELWTLGGMAHEHDRQGRDLSIRAFAELAGSQLTVPTYRGAERDVYLVHATGLLLKILPSLLPDVVEVQRAAVVRPIELAEIIAEGEDDVEVAVPERDTAVIALHDAGIDNAHPYLKPLIIGVESVVPGVPSTSDYPGGHGTQMAGVAAFPNLASQIVAGKLAATCQLISVRLLESETEAGGDPERGPLWADRTVQSVQTAETLSNGRTVIHNLSIGAPNDQEGLPLDRTAWSVSVDQLGWNEGGGRLMVVAAGNAEPITDRDDYPAINLGPPHHDQPAQAWNAITVGGYTMLDQLSTKDASEGYASPLAKAGQLSPHSKTRQGGNRPIKPEIVMEAGNTAPGGGLESPEAQGLTILTTSSKWRTGGSPVRRTYRTSPAAAAASNLLAQLANAHPNLSVATLRGLLIHSSRWPTAAVKQLVKQDLLRSFGYGVPDLTKVMSSASNRPVLVYEGNLVPSPRAAKGKRIREADFIKIPFPLDQFGEIEARLAVTLSYFIEPTESSVRRTYAGGRLRWDMQGPAETSEGFRVRINRLLREPGTDIGPGSYDWRVGINARGRGCIQHDWTLTSASGLTGDRLLAVSPVIGWWEDSTATADRAIAYSLIVSIDFGDVDVDVHNLVSAALVDATSVKIATEVLAEG